MARRTLAQVEAELAEAKAELRRANISADHAHRTLTDWKQELAETVQEAIDAGDVCDEAWERLEGIVERPPNHVKVTIELTLDWEDPPQEVRDLLKEDASLDRHDLSLNELVLEADYTTYTNGYAFTLDRMKIKNVERVED